MARIVSLPDYQHYVYLLEHETGERVTDSPCESVHLISGKKSTEQRFVISTYFSLSLRISHCLNTAPLGYPPLLQFRTFICVFIFAHFHDLFRSREEVSPWCTLCVYAFTDSLGWWIFLQASSVGRIFHRRWTVKIWYPLVSYTSTSVCLHTRARACACTQTHTHLHTLPTIFFFLSLVCTRFSRPPVLSHVYWYWRFFECLTSVDQNFYRHLSHSLAFERIRMHLNGCVSLHTHMHFSN